jgi:hypothetical protein
LFDGGKEKVMRRPRKMGEGLVRRFFVGMSVAMEENGLNVESVLPHGPAALAGLKEGDRLVSADKQPLSLDDFLSTLKATTSITFFRNLRSRTITLKPADIERRGIAAMAEMLHLATPKKKCDAHCNCTIDLQNSICQVWYITKGNGPRGGVLLEKHCTYSAILPGGVPEGDETKCGTKEYF